MTVALIRGLVLCAPLAAGAASAAEAVRLVAQPAIAAGLAAFPRLASGTPQAARINAALAAADARVRTAGEECRAEVASQAIDRPETGWTRRITVAMQGPRYLALVADDYSDCGGLHPNAESFALVYDLRTGLPPNWSLLLPRALVRTVSVGRASDTTPLGMVDSPALKPLYLAAARTAAAKVDPECPAVLEELAGPFMLWPDARQGGIAVQPSHLAHAAAACGVPATISVAALHALGVRPALLDAIAEAHRAGLYGTTWPPGRAARAPGR